MPSSRASTAARHAQCSQRSCSSREQPRWTSVMAMRRLVALVRLAQPPGEGQVHVAAHANRLHVGIAVLAVAAVHVRRVAVEPMIEEPLARHVGVDAEHVGRARRVEKLAQRGLLDAELLQRAPERVRRIHPACEQVEAEPAALVLEPGLVGEPRRAAHVAEVFRLHQEGVRVDGADRPHREHGAGDLVTSMRIADAESRRCGYQWP